MPQPDEMKGECRDNTTSTSETSTTIHRDTYKQARKRKRYHGCNEDCENCEYYDCLKPYKDF